ncbi:hypothetical protein [Nocardioides sp. Leaf285]|uniref:hypothetical protein n=1 Tax=Nocardioides sp. Leaf285 TaxID=1736322 RepID=UPI000702580B|nr:hypothetical protein [Nocardioides sp. Leaf285]KQP62986.1 hypothetical protein ASF47_18410 [Nocardioides sp. Leaf285]
MPNRDRVVDAMTERAVGSHSWRNGPGPRQHICGTTGSDGCGLPRDADEAAQAINQQRAAADAVYVEVIEGVDWNRVIMIAQSRHLGALDHDTDHVSTEPLYGAELPCGDCLTEAALSLDFGSSSWGGDPTDVSPRARAAEEF